MTFRTATHSSVCWLVSKRKRPERTAAALEVLQHGASGRAGPPASGGAEVGGKDRQAARGHHRGGLGRKAVAGRAEGSYGCRRLARFGCDVPDGLKEVICEAGNSVH